MRTSARRRDAHCLTAGSTTAHKYQRHAATRTSAISAPAIGCGQCASGCATDVGIRAPRSQLPAAVLATPRNCGILILRTDSHADTRGRAGHHQTPGVGTEGQGCQRKAAPRPDRRAAMCPCRRRQRQRQGHGHALILYKAMESYARSRRASFNLRDFFCHGHLPSKASRQKKTLAPAP